jgi:Low molecular weight phosphotyrosine protein phosphatase
MTPLFACHANASRSMLAAYLYRHLCGAPALSAGVYAGELLAPRSVALLAHWGIDATAHRPAQLTRSLCDRADALFVMGPLYVRRILAGYGDDLACKTYLFADPFTRPSALGNGQYLVNDPGFDARPVWQMVPDYAWMRERVLAIRLALLGQSPRRLVPAAEYLDVLSSVEPV